MLWGLMDLVIIVFFISLFVKLFGKAKSAIGKWLSAILLVLALPVPSLSQEWVVVPQGEDYCPYGDAVITSKKDPNKGISVDCILYDRKQECWDTWIQDDRGMRKHHCWSIDKYDAWTMDGQLLVDPKTDQVLVKPTGRELTEAELDTMLVNIFKEVK